MMKELLTGESLPLDISEQDVFEAMQQIGGYIDITPRDFREVFLAAYALAVKRLFNSLIAANIMTRTVVTVGEEMALVEAAALLAEKQISGAPVINRSGKIVGVVSEKDFLREMGVGQNPSFMQIATHCLNDQSCMVGRLQNKTAGNIMVQPPITGTPEMRIGEISTLFAERKINRLPIIDEKRCPVGIVTRSDLSHSFHTFGEGAKP